MNDRRRHLILIGCILAALIGVAFLAVPSSPIHKKLTLGLDLQGGLEVVLKAEPPKGHKLTPEDLSRSIDIMRNRIDKLGVSEPEIRKQGSNQIVIQLAGIHNVNDAAALIGKTAVLEFYDFEADVTGPSVSGGLLNATPVASGSRCTTSCAPGHALARQQGQALRSGTSSTRKHVVKAGPAPTRAKLLANEIVRKPKPRAASETTSPKDWKILTVPNDTVVVSCVATNCPTQVPGNGQKGFYLLKHHDVKDFPNNPIPEMTGNQLKLSGDARRHRHPDEPTGRADAVHRRGQEGLPRDHAERGAARRSRRRLQPGKPPPNVQHFAIVLDRQIQSTPYIDYCVNPGRHPRRQRRPDRHGRQWARGREKAGARAADRCAARRVQDRERTDVSATLGKDSLTQAKKAAIVGLLVVALFLLILYRFLGLVAVIGLGIYAAFLYAAILLFNVTMTLPGFAGLILTIGVAADANVVVFERIKEEVRAGKSVRAAISAGYSKGFRTILDANVVTAITALVLFAVATAQVKGFALMLLIGTVISLITAVGATRAMLGLLAGFNWFNKPRFMGAQGQQTAKWLQIDFMRKRYLWFAISGAIVLLGAGALVVRGLNLGIDFKGGSQLTFKTPAAHTTGDVRQVLGDAGLRRCRHPGSRFGSERRPVQDLPDPDKGVEQRQLTKVTRVLESELQTTAPGATTVSSSFGRQIAKSAIIAILVSLFLVVLYIGIRFDLKFAGPVIIAMLHDVVICVGIYALLGREVTSSTVAAILTVLGYSIYDTIIIFDRIRENIPIMRRSSFATIANISLWETIRRSLATSFITLLPVGALSCSAATR